MTISNAADAQFTGTPVLELMAAGAPLADSLDALCRLIDHQSGLRSAIHLLDADGKRLTRIAGPQLPEAFRRATEVMHVTPSTTTCGAAVHRREQVIVTDAASSPLFADVREAVLEARIGAVWSTPFFSRDGRVLGTFVVFDDQPRRPSHANLQLVQRATHLASIAVERHLTEEALRESERLLRLVLDALPVGVAVVDLSGDIILSNPASQRIWSGSIRSGPARYAESKGWWHDTGKRIGPTEWASMRAFATGETSVNEVIDIEALDGVRKVIQNSAVPIRDVSDRITGAVVVNEDITARKAAERELNDSCSQLRTLTGRLMRAQDDERRRIAQMLHEATAQDLAALKMHLTRLGRTSTALSAAERAVLEESITLADQSMTVVRTLSYLLHPPFLDEAGLLSALRWYVAGFAERSGIKVDLDLPSTFERLPQEVETTLFRVVQEALINIHRHARSQEAYVRLSKDVSRLVLEIEDHGRGMAEGLAARIAATGQGVGVGIAGMRERLTQLGGSLEIESSPRGTTLRARVPLAPEPA